MGREFYFMNKFISKIAVALVGCAMAVGVGVAIGSNSDFRVAKATTASVTISDYATEHSWGSSSSSGQKSITVDSHISISCNSGTNSGKYYNDGWRIYQNESGAITVSATDATLNSVTITFTVSNTGQLEYSDSAIVSEDEISVSGTAAVFSVGNSGQATNGQVRVTEISVTYTETGATTPVTITGSRTVSTSVSYTCDGGAESTWALSNVNPAGCMTISGNTVTAVFKGTASLTCTPSDAAYSATTVDLTSNAAARHLLPDGNYYLSASGNFSNPQLNASTYGSLNPASSTIDYFTSSKAWKLISVANENDAYQLRVGDDGQYLVATKGNDAKAIKTDANSSGFWRVVRNDGVDAKGNYTYRLSYSLYSNRCLGLNADTDFRYYVTGNIDINLIPVTRTLSSIVVSGTLSKTNYVKDETFVSTGAVVTGTYTSSAGNCVVDIPLNQVTWSPNTLSTTGTVQVKAVVNTIESTNSFAVTVAAAEVKVTGLTLNKDEVELYPSYTDTITVTVAPANATNQTLSWESDDETVATVDNGVITAVAAGETFVTVSATDGSGVYELVEVTVNAYPTYNLVESEADLYDGMTVVIGAKDGSRLLSTQNTNNRAAVAASLTNKVITPSRLGTVELLLEMHEMSNGTIAYSFWDMDEGVNGGYLYAAGNGTDYYLRTQEENDNNGLFTISINNGSAILTAQGNKTNKYLRYNSGGNTLFGCYAAEDAQADISLFVVNAPLTNKQVVDTFVTRYMKMNSISTSDKGDAESGYIACKANWSDVYDAYTALTEAQQLLFVGGDYDDAVERLAAWASANGKSLNDTTGAMSSIIRSTEFIQKNTSDNALIAIIVVSAVSLSAIGGYFFVRRRKER